MYYNSVKLLMKNNIMNGNDVRYFINFLVEQETNYWFNTPILNLSKLYIAYEFKDKTNETDKKRYIKEQEKYRNFLRSKSDKMNNIYKLKNKSSKEEYDALTIVIYGWTLIKRTNKSVYYVDSIEAFVKHNGVGMNLLNGYIENYNLTNRQILLIPVNILETAVIFWSKYFKYTYNISSEEELNILLQEYDIRYKLKYSFLFTYWRHQ